MSKTTFLGYVPSLKSKHEAKIVGGKAIESKGGSIRYTLQGEYDGRKTLPKTVSKADFESVYGFDAKEAEGIMIQGTKEGKKETRGHKIGHEEKDGFVPESMTIIEGDFDPYADASVPYQMFDNYEWKGAETVVGNPSPADVEPSAPSEKPFPQEPSNENFSAECDDKVADVLNYLDDSEEDLLHGGFDAFRETIERKLESENFSAEMIECGNCDETFTIDEGLDIGGIDYCEECYDTLSAKEESDENFSADYYCTKCDEGFDSITPTDEGQFCNSCLPDSATAHDDMDATTQREDFSAEDPEFYQIEIKYNMEDGWEMLRVWKDEEEAIGAYYDIRYEHPEVRLLEVDSEGDKDVIYIQRNYDLDVKEAFGFGKKDEEEEEPKTQEFTVVLQEGDKLELTDIPEEELPEEEPKEEDSPEESENEEKEAESNETLYIKNSSIFDNPDRKYDIPLYTKILKEAGATKVWTEPLYGWANQPEVVIFTGLSEHEAEKALEQGVSYGELMMIYSKDAHWDAESYEAVQAKVTRPIKEDETEEESEGLSTGAKVALGVGALAVGAAIFGAEEYPQEFLDEFYDFDSNPTADTQDEETLAIAYAAWKHSKENIPYEAETDYADIYGAEIEYDGAKRYARSLDSKFDGANDEGYFPVDEDDFSEMVVDEIGEHTTLDAETFEAGNMMVKLQEVDGEAPYYNCPYCRNELTILGGKGGIVAVCENESRCNGLEIPRQYLDDYEKYHWYVNERSSNENFSADVEMVQCEDPSCDEMMGIDEGLSYGGFSYCEYCYDQVMMDERQNDMEDDYDAEVKEAESKNLKMALGITAVGIGLAAVLGKDKIKTLFDRLGL